MYNKNHNTTALLAFHERLWYEPRGTRLEARVCIASSDLVSCGDTLPKLSIFSWKNAPSNAMVQLILKAWLNTIDNYREHETDGRGKSDR